MIRLRYIAIASLLLSCTASGSQIRESDAAALTGPEPATASAPLPDSTEDNSIVDEVEASGLKKMAGRKRNGDSVRR